MDNQEEDITIIEKFDPKIAELTALVESTKEITATDFEDKKAMYDVKTTRISLRNARTSIEKAGKAARDDANKYAKAVIAYENKLIAIIEPEEKRLKQIEEEAEKLQKLKAHALLLPIRKARLELIGDGIEVEDEVLNTYDLNAFEAYFNIRVSEKNRRDMEENERIAKEQKEKEDKERAERDAELKAREDKIKEDERKLQQEKETREREEKARIEEREKIEREQAEKAEREKREAAALAEAEKAKAEKEATDKLKQEEEEERILAAMPDID